ncbi:MAG: hypothetical protein LUC93_15130 [Planctomycetaceae bacterium]|nr:hypothetical protein [Planctomycetaceae bacterium]
MTATPLPDGPSPRVLITAGPTAEDIDPVRFLTNRSSGRMGIELAEAVLRHGGTPILVLGPTHLQPSEGVRVVRVRSAENMNDAVQSHLAWADSLVMAAAVADYTPAEPLDVKLKKKDGDLILRLKRTPDILAGVRERTERQGKFIVGFSLDVGENLNEGRRKLCDKNLDLIVVNTTASFAADRETAHLIGRDWNESLGEITKAALADRILSCILDHTNGGRE